MIKSSGSVSQSETKPLDSNRSGRYFFGLAERAIWLSMVSSRGTVLAARADGDGGRGDRGTDLFRLEAGHAGEIQAVLEPGQDPVLDRLWRPAGHRPPGGVLHLRRRR